MPEVALTEFIRRMPKVELHVHLEGAIRPATLLQLARRHGVELPASTLEGLHDWFRFTDFAHFVEVYWAICDCIRDAHDLELITAEFLTGQAAQNIAYSEVIFTPFTHIERIPLQDQLEAINLARSRAEQELGVRCGLVPDISRQVRPIEHALQVADFVIDNVDNGIIALGLGGPETDNPPELFAGAFEPVHAAGIPSLPHAGETEGPASVWGAIDTLHAVRIGHGVRSLEDPELVACLRDRGIPLDVSPSSNVCLGVAPSLEEHPLPRLVGEGLVVTINSDDPTMFNTSLTEEYLRLADAFGYGPDELVGFVTTAARVSLLPEPQRTRLEALVVAETSRLRAELAV